MEIPFIQYMRPTGMPVAQVIDLDVTPEQAAKVVSITARGWSFEAEVLTTGLVSFTVYDPVKEDDVGIEIAVNGPPVLDAIRNLIDQVELR